MTEWERGGPATAEVVCFHTTPSSLSLSLAPSLSASWPPFLSPPIPSLPPSIPHSHPPPSLPSLSIPVPFPPTVHPCLPLSPELSIQIGSAGLKHRRFDAKVKAIDGGFLQMIMNSRWNISQNTTDLLVPDDSKRRRLERVTLASSTASTYEEKSNNF